MVNNNSPKTIFTRTFISKDFNPEIEDQVKLQYEALLSKNIQSESDLEEFLEIWSDFSSVLDESASLAYVNMTCNTKDKDAETKYLHLVENISPVCERYENLLKEKFLSSEFIGRIDNEYYALFIKKTRVEKEIFREENIELFTEDALLCQNYQKITGSWMVEFEGKKHTVQEMAPYLEKQDRDLRERSYMARVKVHLQDSGILDDLYDKMLNVRGRIAHNAGFTNYRDYKFKEKGRFDYTPDDCMRFHDAIGETVVPLLTEWMKKRAEKLKIPSIRPWDLNVDPDGFDVIHAFNSVEELCEKVGRVFYSMNPRISECFEVMREKNLLDLASREGKAPGGYMTELGERRLPFIFMNAVGSKRDVDTLLHEAGHSVHAFQARHQRLKSYRSSPLEFAEVASMSLELLGRPYFREVYKPEEVERVKQDQLKKIVEFFPFMSMIDSFQHWVYTNEINGREARGEKWQELNKKFQPYLDMTGLDAIEKTRWQYPHVYTVPFYYIEYGIAQIGALQIWKNSLKDEKNALGDYLRALSLGGSVSLPELFRSGGISFSMTKETLAELVKLIRDEVGE